MAKNTKNKSGKSSQAARIRQYKADLKTLEARGFYSPKAKTLTPWRKRQINKLMRENREFVGDDVFFVSTEKYSKKSRKDIADIASSLQMKTTKRGLLIPKEGHTNARIRKTKRGEYEIYREGKTKRGPNKGKKYYDITPLEPIDKLIQEKDKLRDIAKKLGAPFSPKSKDRLYFKIVDQFGEGISNAIFNNIESLMTYLDAYVRSEAARLFMYRHIVIEKTTVTAWKGNRTRRRNIKRKKK